MTLSHDAYLHLCVVFYDLTMYFYIIMDWVSISDNAIVRELGDRIKKKRLAENMTQSQLAERAGAHRTTIGLVERGQSTTIVSYVQILRALDGLDVFEHFLSNEATPSPMQVLEERAVYRRRATGKKEDDNRESEW